MNKNRNDSNGNVTKRESRTVTDIWTDIWNERVISDASHKKSNIINLIKYGEVYIVLGIHLQV